MATSEDMTEKQVKDFIKSIITSNPIISTIQSIQKDYKDMIGLTIPCHKFNYNSVEHFLKSIPDTCRVQGTGPFAQVTLTPSEKSAHINDMVTQQKINTRSRRKAIAPRRSKMGGYRMEYNSVNNNRRPVNWRSTFNYSFSPNTSSSHSSLDYTSLANQPNTINKESQNVNAVNTNTSSQLTNNQNTSNLNINNQNSYLKLEPGKLNVDGIRSESTETGRNYILEQNKLRSRGVKEHLDTLIKKQEQLGNIKKVPTTSSRRSQNTKRIHDSDYFTIPENAPILDKNTLRYLNISINDSAQERSKETRDTQEDACLDESIEKLKNLSFQFKSVEEDVDEDTSNVPKRVQCNLRTLIVQFNDGIWCSDLPGHYRQLFRRDLVYMDYGYTSLIEMCIALKHIFHYVRPGRDDFKLYDRSKPLPENVEKYYTMASYDVGEKVSPDQALPELEWTDFNGHIPDDVFKYGDRIPGEFIPSDTHIEAIFDVVVVEIYDPSKFWFYLGTSDNKTPLDELMDNMQGFYSQPANAKEYAIPSGALREELYCVQVIYGEYHRAKIVRMVTDCPDEVRVLFIDYGTVCKVPFKGMCFLHSKFAVLKAQAIRCRLANIVPELKGHPWPRTTSDRFRELVNRRDTKIKISYIDWDQEYVCVFLADVTDTKNIQYINEILVNEGHALWDGETQIVPFVLSNFKCRVQNIHLFPTFFELEYGLTPNSNELYSLEEMLVPLQFCLPQYFEPIEPISSSDDEIYEECFIETVKNHRKFTPLRKVDVSTLLNPPPINFDLFGDLKEEMIEFCKRENLGGVQSAWKEDKKPKAVLCCDIEEANEENLPCYNAIERDLEEYEPVRLIKQDKELSASIIEKLEKYSLLNSESSCSETSRVSSDESRTLMIPEDYEAVNLGMGKGYWSAEQIAEHELSTILEHCDEVELDDSDPSSPKHGFFGFTLNPQNDSDINIFDNPEAFEQTSNSSETDEDERAVTPESFLKTVERICTKDLEDSDILGERTSTAENSETVCDNFKNPFKFDINADLKDAFKTFLTTQKSSSTSNSNSHPSSGHLSVQSEELLLDRSKEVGNCKESFLKCNDEAKMIDKVIDNVRDWDEDDLSIEDGRFKACENDRDTRLKANLEDTKESFVPTLSSNNPFRTYFDGKDDELDGNLLAVSTEYSTALANSESTHSSITNLLETDPKFTDAAAETASTKTSESDGSDYKVFVPRNSSSRVSNVAAQENIGSWVQGQLMTGGMNKLPGVGTPPRIGTSPRPFTPPGLFTPMAYSPYPQWSNGVGYPVPQYPQWSNGNNYPAPYPSYPHPRETLRPPPGFGPYPGPSNYNTYMVSPRMIPTPPMYAPYQGAAYYGPPRQMVPAPSLQPSTSDFYDMYNKNMLNKSKEN